MRWFAWVMVSLVGCSAAPPAAPSNVQPPGPSAAPDPIVDHLRAYRDDMCACDGRHCVRQVDHEIEDWRHRAAKDLDKPRAKSTEEDQLEQQIASCERTAKTAGPGKDPIWEAMTHFRDEMCACADHADAACARTVTDEMSKWATAQTRQYDVSEKPTEDEMKLGQQLAECTTKAMMAGMQQQQQPPPPPPPP